MNILLEQFPLLKVFSSLRDRYGLPLGVDDYLLLLHALQAGFGIETLTSLEELCCTLWGKSPLDARTIHSAFRELPSIQSSSELTSSVPLDQQERIESKHQEVNNKEENLDIPAEISQEEDKSYDVEPDTSVQIVQSVRRHRNVEEAIPRTKFVGPSDYFPVTRRQMKQSWRHLRRLVREGPKDELDITATTEKIGREGVLFEPVLLPRRINRASLGLLVDQDGSMAPFHTFTRYLIETAGRDGRLGKSGVYYFHDFPDNYLYLDSGRTKEIEIQNFFSNISEKTAILIVSDAGAARGRYDQDRVNKTYKFIQQLQQNISRYAWINPMPRDRWRNTTAGKIAELLPMFELSRQGLENAINALRGRYIYSKVQY